MLEKPHCLSRKACSYRSKVVLLCMCKFHFDWEQSIYTCTSSSYSLLLQFLLHLSLWIYPDIMNFSGPFPSNSTSTTVFTFLSKLLQESKISAFEAHLHATHLASHGGDHFESWTSPRVLPWLLGKRWYRYARGLGIHTDCERCCTATLRWTLARCPFGSK